MSFVVLAASALAGFGLGLVFFGLLWATVRRLPDARHAAALTIASYLVRVAILAIGLWAVMDGDPRRLLAALLGLLAARALVVRRVRGAAEPAADGAEGR